MKTALGVVGLVGAGLVGMATLHARGPATTTTSSAWAPATMAAQAEVHVAAEGRVVAYPGAEVKVGAERSGRLVRVLVQEGQAVRAVALLAEIESDEIRAALDDSSAHVVEGEADVRLAELARERRQNLMVAKKVSD